MSTLNKEYIFTVLDAVAEAKNKKLKIQVLQDNDSSALRGVLRGGFDPSLEFNLPAGDPDVQKIDLKGARPVYLSLLLGNFPKFIKTSGEQKTPKHTIENEFLRILRRVHPEEYDLLILMKDGKLTGKYKGLTKKLVVDAFPGLIKG